MSRAELMRAADRMWNAADALDAPREGSPLWRWTFAKCEELRRQGKAEDPEAVLAVARVLERRLERERRGEVA